MNRFTAHNRSTAHVDATRAEIWSVLTNPKLLPQLTPILQRIDVVDGNWVWTLATLHVLAKRVSPSFTEIMTFDEPSRIEFTHDPTKRDEQAGAEGSYTLVEQGSGTQLSIDLAVSVDLPLPKVAKAGVVAGMNTVMSAMGARFSTNLMQHVVAARPR